MDSIGILGSGMVGRTIARDLCDQFQVTVFDQDEHSLAELSSFENIQKVQADLSQNRNDLNRLLQPFNLIIGALPGYLGFETLKRLIELGKNFFGIFFSCPLCQS